MAQTSTNHPLHDINDVKAWAEKQISQYESQQASDRSAMSYNYAWRDGALTVLYRLTSLISDPTAPNRPSVRP